MVPDAILGSAVAPYRLKFSPVVDLSDIDIVLCPDRPWIAEIEALLPVDAPSSASPLCCYINTVIFYEKPSRVVDGNFAEHGRCETALRLDDVLLWQGRQWIITSGSVAWTKGAWHMVWSLRRLPKDRHIKPELTVVKLHNEEPETDG